MNKRVAVSMTFLKRSSSPTKKNSDLGSGPQIWNVGLTTSQLFEGKQRLHHRRHTPFFLKYKKRTFCRIFKLIKLFTSLILETQVCSVTNQQLSLHPMSLATPLVCSIHLFVLKELIWILCLCKCWGFSFVNLVAVFFLMIVQMQARSIPAACKTAVLEHPAKSLKELSAIQQVKLTHIYSHTTYPDIHTHTERHQICRCWW